MIQIIQFIKQNKSTIINDWSSRSQNYPLAQILMRQLVGESKNRRRTILDAQVRVLTYQIESQRPSNAYNKSQSKRNGGCI
jgi:hypothetical protein